MKCHQILTGAVNSGDNTYSVGSVEGIRFTVYSSGCNIVILSSNFERVQIIPGVLNGNVQVNCIDASTDVGKIAACYGGPIKSNQLTTLNTTISTNKIVIFEPTPLIGQISEHRLDYNWIKTAEIEPNSAVSVLSWNIEGTKLLTGGVELKLWQLSNTNSDISKCLALQQNDEGLRMKPIKSDEKEQQDWACVWSCRTSTPVCYLLFSPDSTLFCSAGRSDRLVKIWYESATQNYSLSSILDVSNASSNSQLNSSSTASLPGVAQPRPQVSYSFIYLAHPRAVTGISWRKASKYMPRASVANMLVTSCRDNICRLWVQTLLPEDGLVNVSQLDGVSNLVVPRAQTQRHRQKLLQRFKHMKSFSHFKRRQHLEHESGGNSDLNDGLDTHPIPNLPSTFSVHDFHGFGVHGTSVTPGGLHFHLTATINAENDIPLVPSLTQHLSEPDLAPSANIGPKVTISNNENRPNSPSVPQIFPNNHQNQHHHEESDKPLFVVNWLNNKEMAFTQSAEKILHEIVANIIKSENENRTQQVDQDEVSVSSNSNTDNTVDSVVRSKPQAQVSPSRDSSSTNSLTNINNGTANESQNNDIHRDLDRKTVADYLDRKLESLMRDWHNNSDLLYSIHPLDGSLLIWLVEYLDEPSPSTFRQPQISFSSRIPSSIPLGDASTISHNIALYSPDCFLDLKTVLYTSSSSIINAALNAESTDSQRRCPISLAHKSQQLQHQQQHPLFGTSSHATPTLCMITKHNNGSMNLWKLTFGDKSKFTQLLSISHSKRVCGHRFRVNDVTCHPILPLLLTTSHHNLPGSNQNRKTQSSPHDLQTPNSPDSTSFLVSPSSHDQQSMIVESSTFPNVGFCSELILWKVEPVGPLLKSGGISELARINSLESTAFANVAWVPTLLPSTALGTISNSPSACFVASDGRQLRVYQAVIDARSLLAEAQRYMLNTNDQRRFFYDSSDDEDDDYSAIRKPPYKNSKPDKSEHDVFRSLFKIVSLQSTARPGCVLELSPIVDARHDWQNTQLLHVFQEQLILGNHSCKSNKPSNEPLDKNTSDGILPENPQIDFDNANAFEETFYLVVVEKTGTTSTLHMWQIVMISRGRIGINNIESSQTCPDDEDSSRSVSPDNKETKDQSGSNQTPPLNIKTRKVCVQKLSLPADVEVIHAAPAAGHLSSSNIYPACYAPFLICTACSDNKVRFWRCDVKFPSEEHSEPTSFDWVEYEMSIRCGSKSPETQPTSSVLELPGSPLYVSCAYSGRIACAFKFGHSYMDIPSQEESADKEDHRFINIGIAIFECQSSGGSEWILEDTIKVERIPLLEPNTSSLAKISEFDIAPLVDTTLRNHQTSRKLVNQISSSSLSSNNPFLSETYDSVDNSLDHTNRVANITRLLSVPSYTTIQSLKKIIAEQGNQFTFFQKSPVLLDWVSTEDGSHILTCSVGHKIALFAPVSQAYSSSSNESSKPSVSFTGNINSASPLLSSVFQQQQPQNAVSPSNLRMNILDPLNTVSITRWMMLRITQLDSVDGLPPLPMQLSWVRDGIMVVGMDNEMVIFTQWNMPMPSSIPSLIENQIQSNKSKRPMATHFPFDSVEFPSERVFNICKADFETNSINKAKQNTKNDLNNFNAGDKFISDLPDDFGIFEAFRLSSPVIPQYHPKQLMEFLAFGKIHRVRAILSHLVMSLCSINSVKEYLHHPANMQQQHGNSFESERSPRSWTRTRALSVAAQQLSPHDINSSPLENSLGDSVPIVAEEIQLDYTEIASIRPLPLYALLQADEGISTDKALQNDDKIAKNDSGFSWSLDANDSLEPDSLFDYSYKTQVEETLDEFLGNRSAFNFSSVATSKFLRNQSSQNQQNESDLDFHISIEFDQRQARLLTKLLTHSHLPGLSSLDQMHLLALADSLASFDEISGQQDQTLETTGAGLKDVMDEQLKVTANSLDDCGLRYLLNMRQHIYLLKCLPLMQRKALQKNGLGLHNIIWAFHSETQEELVQLILSSSNKITWDDLRELGVGFWVRNNALLRKMIERLAKAAFKTKNDPLDASIYYLAMKKKNLVWGLYRSIQDKKMTDFFAHDFTEDKWRKAALKNAYVLMGKQRFEHAVSFFLLAGSLWDAVEICLNKLEDLQLAMVIIRLFEGGDIESVPDTLKKLLQEEVLGFRKGVQDLQYAYPDPFLRSMAYWMLHEYNLSLSTLLEVNVGAKHHKSTEASYPVSKSIQDKNSGQSPTQDNNFDGLHPSVFNFYLYLRTQPLIVRRAQVAQQSIGAVISKHTTLDNKVGAKNKKSHMFNIGTANRFDAVAITPFERRLFFLTAYRHLRAGCPSLALEVLSRLPTNIMSYSEKNEIEECSRRMSFPDTVKNINPSQDHSQKAENLFSNSSSAFDWGSTPSSIFAPVSTDDFVLKFDDDEDKESDKEEEDSGLQMKNVSQEPETNAQTDDSLVKIDAMAQQFKFISCLKIMMEELSTLATGFEVDGGQLRYQLYVWLERSVQILKEVCNYHTFSMRSAHDRASIDSEKRFHGLVPIQHSPSSIKQSGILINVSQSNRKASDNSTASLNAVPSLHEILIADKEDFESKMERCRRRKAWLTANEALLRNLLSYCSLHGAHGGGLASVRMELILLLQELQQDRSPQQQLLSPLPLPTTLPLLTASVASQKTVVADPIRHLQSVIHDILQTMTDINTYVHIPTDTVYSSLPDFLALPPFMVSGTATNLSAWISTQDGQPLGQQSNSYISTLYTLIHILRDLGISLSSCIYQSLCDCDSVNQNSSICSSNGYSGGHTKKSRFASTGQKVLLSKLKESSASNAPAKIQSGTAVVTEEKLAPSTSPLKWPGVQSLQSLIVREKDEDLPKLHTLLCEGFVAVYLSQLVYALTICDSNILYRLVGLDFDEKSWGDLFGGGTKKLLYVSTSSILNGLGQTPGTISPSDLANGTSSPSSSPHIDLFNTLSKQRIKLHMKIMEQLNQASAVAAEAVSAVSAGMVNVATSPSNTFQNIGSQLSQNSPNVASSGGMGITEQRPTYREIFVPPQISIINYLMIKPELPDELNHLDYDSMGSDEEGDDEDSALGKKFQTDDDDIDDDEYNDWANGGQTKSAQSKLDKALEKRKANLEYELYAWCIIRLATAKIAYDKLSNFLNVSGLEKGDLPTTSPFIHATLRTLLRWQCALQFYMNEFTNLPDQFLPNMYVDSEWTRGPSIQKYKSLLEVNNTPFRSGYTSTKSSKRLWNYLVRQPSVQDIFIRYIFGKTRSMRLAREHGATSVCNESTGVALSEQQEITDHKTMQPSTEAEDSSLSGSSTRRPPEPMRIVHKDQDIISAFCLNRSNPGLIALSTPKEVQELNIKPLLDSCIPWMEEDTELDILNLRQKFDPSLPVLSTSYIDFLLVQHPTDRVMTSPGGQAIQRQQSSQQQTPTHNKQTILIKRHKTETVRRLASHPLLPLYLSGGQDGSVSLWEWNHQYPISTPRPAGTFAKVTRVQFNQQGNKFGVTDSDGNLSLWQMSATHNKAFFSMQCHNKTCSDFTFLGSSSLLMTAGHSTDHRNVVLWDTLMPAKKCMVTSFACHEHHGAASITYAPLNQLIITGGKKGDVFIFDMRQRIQRDRFQAHDSAVKCIALDPGEEFFATGSADGDIKVWSLVGPSRTLLFSFQGEHTRNTFFRNIGMGVSNLYIDNCGRLFSCGADGSLKMRHLPTVECQPKWFFSPTSPSSQLALFGDYENGLNPANSSEGYSNGIVNTYQY